MLAVLITLTPGQQNEIIDCQKGDVRIAVLPIIDDQPLSNSALGWLEWAYRLREFTHEWLQNAKYTQYQPLLPTQDEWTIVKYVIEEWRPFRYWTLWMSQRYTVTLHPACTVYKDMFDQMYGVMWVLADMKTQWKVDLFFAVKLLVQKLSKYYTEVTPAMGKLLIAANILDPLRLFWTLRLWD